jgi:transposase
MLKLYIYGYLNRVQSSRRLEREAGRNLEVMWLSAYPENIARDLS